jgi:fimbrial chaperone protein
MLRSRRRVLLFALPVAILMSAFVSGARALSVQPLFLDIEVRGNNAHGTIRVTNTSAKTVPIEFETFKLEVNETGQMTKTKEIGAFTVFPPQATLGPGKTQSFRLIWMGDANLKTSKTFTLAVTELPIEMGPRQSGVQVAMQFSVLVNVSPAGSAPAIEILKTEITGSTAADRKPTILVENKGTRHAILAQGALEVRSGNWSAMFVGDQVTAALNGIGLLQPGKRRSFTIKTPVPPSVTQYEARIIQPAKQ